MTIEKLSLIESEVFAKALKKVFCVTNLFGQSINPQISNHNYSLPFFI
jgi:hypothetical protein